MTNQVNICGHCHFPIHPSEPMRHFGFFVAHQEAECLRLLQAEIERLRAHLAPIAANNDFLFLAEMAEAARDALNGLPAKSLGDST